MWLFERDLPDTSEAMARWKESSLWDNTNEIVYGLSVDDSTIPTVDDDFVLMLGNVRRTVTVVEIITVRGFKWTALITINSQSKSCS